MSPWPVGGAAGPKTAQPWVADRVTVLGRWEEWLIYVSMALLLASTIQGAGLIGSSVKVLWLSSVALLAVLNVGAAFGVYIAALAVFGSRSFGGWGSLVDRPDNYALLILVTWLVTRKSMARSTGSWQWNWSLALLVGFVAYGLLHLALMGLFSRDTFAWYMRAFGLPMVMALLLTRHGFAAREFRALVRALLVLGAYTALVAIAEGLGWQDLIVPAWIAAPTVDSPDVVQASAIYPGRSGGLLMQPAWNALALSLIYCLAILSSRLFRGRTRWLSGAVAVLSLVGVFLSYTRAAWLACALASLVLLLRPSPVRTHTLLKRFGVAAASLAFILALVVLPDTTARSRMGDSGTVLFRLNLWKVALGMAAERPLLGSGFGTFGGNLADHQGEMTLGAKFNVSATPAHNTMLNVLVELGAIGLFLYLGALVATYRKAKATAVQFWGRDGAVWVAVFFGVYFLQAQFAFAHEPTTNQIFFGTMGALAGHQWGAAPRTGLPETRATCS